MTVAYFKPFFLSQLYIGRYQVRAIFEVLDFDLITFFRFTLFPSLCPIELPFFLIFLFSHILTLRHYVPKVFI